MLYKSTRGGESGLTFEQVLFSAYAQDGGLYVPENLPTISNAMLLSWKNHSFAMICAEVMHLFTGLDLACLNEMTERAYAGFNDGIDPLPMTAVNGVILLDASCGPTLAFKDVGQQIVAQLMNHYLSRKNRRAAIMVDTSGDTGPAAISAVKGCSNLDITVLYPYQRVSAVQELQMITVLDENVHVYRTEGNNDDQSSVLKEIFSDEGFVRSNHICSINSINWARIAAQSTYYVWAYLQVYDTRFSIGREINFTIPSGAFGNGMGGLLAKLMGLPIGRIVCATNMNDIVHRTISNGDMSMTDNYQTISPAMDIQFAYNLERMVYYMCGQDCARLQSIMTGVEKQFMMTAGAEGVQLDADVVASIQGFFSSCSVTDEDTLVTIRDTHVVHGYSLCPHSAIGVHAATKVFRDLTAEAPMICVLTAHPSKFDEAYNRATAQPPPQLPRYPVDVLHTLPTKFEWLRKNGRADWRGEWITTLKTAVASQRSDTC